MHKENEMHFFFVFGKVSKMKCHLQRCGRTQIFLQIIAVTKYLLKGKKVLNC